MHAIVLHMTYSFILKVNTFAFLKFLSIVTHLMAGSSTKSEKIRENNLIVLKEKKTIKDVFNKIIMLVKSECIYYRTQTSQSKPWSGTHKDNKKRGRPKNT